MTTSQRRVSVLLLLGLLAACRTRPNPAWCGSAPCDDGGGAGDDASADAGSDQVASDADGSADGADGTRPGVLAITSPESTTYVNGSVQIDVSATAAPPPVEVVLKANGMELARITAPYSYTWDTRGATEDSYRVTAEAGNDVSAPVTVVVDRTAPTLLSRTPPSDAPIVDITEPAVLVYSEPLLPSSVTSAAVSISIFPPGPSLQTMVTLSADGTTITATLVDLSAVPVPKGLQATVAGTITDLAGNPIARVPLWIWTVPLWLDYGSLAGGRPSLALDMNNQPWVVTTPGLTTSTLSLQVAKRRSGTSWDTAPGSPATAGNVVQALTSIAVDASGAPLVGWSESAPGGQPSSIHVARWSAGTWDRQYGQLDAVAGQGTSTYNPALALDSAGRPVVAWAEDTPGLSRTVYVARWSGTAWDSLGFLNQIGPTQARLALGQGDAPLLAWCCSGGIMRQGVSVSSGSTWTTPATYGNNSAPALALDSLKRPVVAFIDPSVSSTTINVSVLAAGSLAPFVSPLAATGTAPAGAMLALTRDDRPVVAWIQASDGQRRVMMARWTGSSWDNYATISGIDGNGTDAQLVALALDSHGLPVIAWEEIDANNNSTTFVRRANK